MNEMRIMNRQGDNKVTWEVDVQEQVDAAQKQFEELVQQGYFAYKSMGNGQGEMITEFDPNAEKLVLFPPIAGG